MYNNTSIIRDGNCGAGCVGGFFTMGNSPDIYGISNNHVIANLNNCRVGDLIRHEASGLTAGELTHWVPLKTHNDNDKINQIDMALFRIEQGETLQWKMKDSNLTKPRGYIEPRQNGSVYMPLENGDFSTGKITKTYTNHLMQFLLCGQPFLFSRLIEITPTEKQQFSQPGNSGSIILSSSHFIVGLLIGSNSDGTRSYAIPFVEGILRYAPLQIL